MFIVSRVGLGEFLFLSILSPTGPPLGLALVGTIKLTQVGP